VRNWGDGASVARAIQSAAPSLPSRSSMGTLRPQGDWPEAEMEVKASRMPPERPAMNGLVCSGCESQLTAGPPNGLALANFGFRLM
jgi:hypothetical protein